MGISLASVHLLGRSLRRFGDLSERTILTLGVQDCHFTYDSIVRFLQKHAIPYRPLPADAIKLTDGFRWASEAERARYAQCIHQLTFFELLGFRRKNIHALDASPYEGADHVHDLNAPIGEELAGRFDVVFDGGTLEHVFSIKDALLNIAALCRVGGLAVNYSPVDSVNHGFVNFNAEIFRDFYSSNGFEQIELVYLSVPTPPHLSDRYYLRFAPQDFRHALQPFYATAAFSVFRKREAAPTHIPTQGYYARLWADRSASLPNSRAGLRKHVRAIAAGIVDKNYALSTLLRNAMALRKATKVVL